MYCMLMCIASFSYNFKVLQANFKDIDISAEEN